MRKPRRTSVLILILIVALVGLGSTRLAADRINRSAGGQAAGTSAGTAIGNTIKTAITTAFPGIMSIINAIWPGHSTQTVNKTTATQKTADMTSKANDALTSLGSAANDLNVVSTFLEACVTANDGVIAIRATLRGKTSLSSQETNLMNHDWTIASASLHGLASQGGMISTVSDRYTQVTLRTIVTSSDGLAASITREIGQGDAGIPLLASDLETLYNQLSAVIALSGEIIGDVGIALKGVKTTAAGGQGEANGTPEQQQRQAAFQHVLLSKFPGLADTLRNP